MLEIRAEKQHCNFCNDR